jgi:hypothetical protein
MTSAVLLLPDDAAAATAAAVGAIIVVVVGTTTPVGLTVLRRTVDCRCVVNEASVVVSRTVVCGRVGKRDVSATVVSRSVPRMVVVVGRVRSVVVVVHSCTLQTAVAVRSGQAFPPLDGRSSTGRVSSTVPPPQGAEHSHVGVAHTHGPTAQSTGAGHACVLQGSFSLSGGQSRPGVRIWRKRTRTPLPHVTEHTLSRPVLST